MKWILWVWIMTASGDFEKFAVEEFDSPAECRAALAHVDDRAITLDGSYIYTCRLHREDAEPPKYIIKYEDKK